MWKEGEVHRPCQGIEKVVEHGSDDYTNCNWCSWYNHQRIGTRTGGLGYNRVEIIQTTVLLRSTGILRSPGDLKRLVTQTPVRNHQLTLVWKTLKREQILKA